MANEISLEQLLPQMNMPSSKLEELKKQRFTQEDRDERIARSLSALNQQSSIHLSPEEWQRIAEDPDYASH